MSSERLRFISLFSGIGGFDLGLERAGMECVAQVDIDPFCRKVLAKHWPHVMRLSDVRECGKHNLPPADLICGGFPCQDVSLAGERSGLDGKRSTLWGEFARIIREIEPRWILAENVFGLFSSDNGQFFGNILRDLAQFGYDAEWHVLPAAAFGAPHIRQRVFILAYPGEIRRNAWWPKQSLQGLGEFSETLMGNTDKAGFQITKQKRKLCRPIAKSDWWAIEPGMDRVANGVPDRVDRIGALGNAVVPQVVEWIGRRIIEADIVDEP